MNEQKIKIKKLQRQRSFALYPKFEHSKLETQDVEFNSNGEIQVEHSFAFIPKHFKHP